MAGNDLLTLTLTFDLHFPPIFGNPNYSHISVQGYSVVGQMIDF